jgi:hypothetical protein
LQLRKFEGADGRWLDALKNGLYHLLQNQHNTR